MTKKTHLPFLFLASLFANLAHSAEHKLDDEKKLALVADGGGSFPMMGGGSYGAGLRLEYATSRFISVILPLDYRFIAYGGFSDSPQFDAFTAGIGGRFYFSQLFWAQKTLKGFFAEGSLGVGYAVEQPGDYMGVSQPKNQGATFSLSAALGYSYAFDFGLVIGGMVKISGRGFSPPIKQSGIIAHPNPELLAQIGWAF